MEEPTTYCGASSNHVFCENYTFQENHPLRLFKRDQSFGDFNWLDIKNCSGHLDKNTFKNLPNIEILNFHSCNFQKIHPNVFDVLKNLTSVAIWTSIIPLEEYTFEDCQKLNSLRFVNVQNIIRQNKHYFSKLLNLESLTFENVTDLDLNENIFKGLHNLQYLFITSCSVKNLSLDAFDPLSSLDTLYISSNTFKNFDQNAFFKLKNLKTLCITNNTKETTRDPLEINYQLFVNLTDLETVGFPAEILRKLDLGAFKKLKKVQLDVEQSDNDVVKFLTHKDVEIEYVCSGKTSEVDLNDPEIQIRA